MTAPETARIIEAFIREISRVAEGDVDFSQQVDLFDYGYLDSFGIVELISRVQEKFGIDMTNVDFYGGKMRSIAALADYVDAQQVRTRAGGAS